MNGLRPRVLGITGNIATGKTTVSRHLRDLGAAVIDSDLVVRDLYRAGEPVAAAVAERFGADLLTPTGIDRAALAAIAFADATAMRELEAIVHPGVFHRVSHWLAAGDPGQPRVVEAIKLVEGRNALLLDELWILTSPRRIQLQRLARNRSLSPAAAAARVDSQSNTRDKLALFASRCPGLPARLIFNGESEADLLEQIGLLWEAFLAG